MAGKSRKELTPTQQSILYKARNNPEWNNTDIADAVGCSDSHVSETLNRWDPEEMREDGTVPDRSTSETSTLDTSKGGVLIIGGAVVWVMLLNLSVQDATIDPLQQQALWTLAALSLITSPLGVALDAQFAHSHDADWKPNRVIWPLIGLFAVVVGPIVYGFLRVVRS